MIPVKTNKIVVQGNLNGDKIAMGVHKASLQKLIGILTDLYSDPTAAIIREYSTNAIDSHIAAGVTRPIEVTLPSPLSPYFRVRDFGLGLSVDDVREVYSQYGASTKDTSNDFNGMLGLGSKSALTYTNQFNVVATKGGVKATVVVSRAADGTGTMEVVDTVGTDEPNGVEVIIPVAYSQSFEEKARKFYSFWKPGTVLVNGKDASTIVGNEVAPGIFSVHALRGDYIVQGNVAYPVEHPGLYSQGYYKEFGVVAYVPNGSVSFAPSREALMYDDVTNAEIARIRKEFKAGLADSIQADIDDAPDHAEALVRFSKWKRMLGYELPNNLSYKKTPIPLRWDGRFQIFTPNRYRYQTQSHRNIDYNALKNACIITDYTPDGTSQAQKNKIKAWAEDNDIKANDFILVEKMFGAPWTDSVDTASWLDVKETKVNKNTAPRTGVRGKQEYKVWDFKYDVWKDNSDPKPTAEVFYVSPADNFNTNGFRFLTDLFPDAMIVMLGKNRWDKFLRDFPNALHLDRVLEEVYKTYKSKLTDDDLTALNLDYYTKEALVSLDPSRIDDPEVVHLIKIAKAGTKSKGIDYYTNIRNLARYNNKHLPEAEKTVENPLDKYPLIGNTRSKIHEHVYLYMNAAFAAEN